MNSVALGSPLSSVDAIPDEDQWTALLSPVPGHHPAGVDLRYEGTYDRILQARREDDPALEQGVWKRDLKKADWETVRLLCLEALTTRSKDYTIAVWLLEAWLHVEGFPGVTKGLRLISELSERYWTEAYPMWDPENPEPRIAPFLWINEKLSVSLKQIPLCTAPSVDGTIYSWADWEQALRLEQEGKRNPDLLETRAAQGKVTREKFLQCVEKTPVQFYSALQEECRNILGLCLTIDRKLDECCGKPAPGLATLKASVQAVLGFSSNILRAHQETRQGMEDTPEEKPVLQEAQLVSMDRQAGSVPPIGSRDEAYARLLDAAEYLHRHEPHSPTPYLVKRAVSWGRMTLSEVLEDLARSEIGIQGVYALLGGAGPVDGGRD
jgi:type VI secretion system protein ImpA